MLRELGVSNGDKVAFVRNDDGSMQEQLGKRPISDFIGIFATGEKRSWEQDLALLHEIRYGDEEPPSKVFGDANVDRR